MVRGAWGRCSDRPRRPVQELSKITMPIAFNEPLSFLQRLTEYMEHVHLLHRACRLPQPLERMQVGAGPRPAIWSRRGGRHLPGGRLGGGPALGAVPPGREPLTAWASSAVRRCLRGVGRGVPVGEDRQALQPAAGGDLRAREVRRPRWVTGPWGRALHTRAFEGPGATGEEPCTYEGQTLVTRTVTRGRGRFRVGRRGRRPRAGGETGRASTLASQSRAEGGHPAGTVAARRALLPASAAT